MYFADEITHVHGVKDGAARPTGPIRTKPLLIIVEKGGKPHDSVLQISQDAACELVAELSLRLKARGCL